MKRIDRFMKANRIWLLALLLPLAACSNNLQATPVFVESSVTRTNTPVLAPSPTLTQGLLSTSTPSFTPTWTVPPTRTPWQTRTPTATSTPLPPTPTDNKRPKAEIEKQMLSLLTDNGGCKFPCWWGFIPGQTDWITLRDFFVQNDWTIRYSSEKQELDALFRIEQHRFNIGSNIFVEGNKINVIRLFLQEITETGDDIFEDPFFISAASYYSISNVLKEYGPPDDIRIYLSPPRSSEYIDEPPNSFLVLFYLEDGFAVEYSGSRDNQPNGTFRVCARKSAPIFSLWFPEKGISSSEAFIRVYKGFLSPESSLELFELYKPLKEATSLTIDEFYTQFQDPNACLESPAQIWTRK